MFIESVMDKYYVYNKNLKLSPPTVIDALQISGVNGVHIKKCQVFHVNEAKQRIFKRRGRQECEQQSQIRFFITSGVPTRCSHESINLDIVVAMSSIKKQAVGIVFFWKRFHQNYFKMF